MHRSLVPSPRAAASHRPRTASAAGAVLVALLLVLPSPLAAQHRPASTGEPWSIITPLQSSVVVARDGSFVGEIGREARTSVSIRTLPTFVPQAFVAVEDQRFYQHDGVDVVGVLGALKDAVTGDPRGASTITQQLVGNMHPDVIDRTDRTIGRKLREQQAAREMEKRYTKAQILEAYLNQINLGRGWYGVEAASRHWFGKSASKLTLAEAASLASMPKSPVYFDPVRYAARHLERRNTVLALMAQQKYITDAQLRQARAEPVRTVPDGGVPAGAGYFVDVVRQQAERAGVQLSRGGYRVVTTLDPAMQRAAAAALEAGIRRVEARPGYRHPVRGGGAATSARATGNGSPWLQGAVVALDAATGEVRALLGGRSYAESPFNRAANGVRQPGSAFKPVVYAAAIADSLPPNELLADTAIAIPLENGTVYRPDNADHLFSGTLTMRQALTGSRNVVAVQLGQQLGMDTIAAFAERLGIRTPIAPYPSSAIGASAVRPLELVAAYTAFGNGGLVAEPRFIARIEDRTGRVIWTAPAPAPTAALDPAVAYVVRDMMRDVVERGTATSVRRLLPASVPVAGKTGTTNDNTDVWFVGLTPEIVAGVWLGFDRPTSIAPGVAGGSLAAPVFGEMLAGWYRSRAGSSESAAWDAPPEGVATAELDRDTGLLATAETPAARRYREVFLVGTEPGAHTRDGWRLFQWGPIAF